MNNNSLKNIVLIPRVSEKAYAISQMPGAKTYVFEVPLNVNKNTIAKAISASYDVTVTSVRTTVVKGKVKQSYRKGGRPQVGQRSDIKKAYITLREGDSLPIFEEIAAEEAKAAEAEEKAAKKAAKQSKKEAK